MAQNVYLHSANVFVAKAKRQQHCFSVAKAKRQLQLHQGEIDAHAFIVSCYS
ncbi:hypothetical protein [Lysinibacillus sp. YR326]|uniref:hypothetical protein n=1 Tax=Lysinibacillus xylanilyticus TaxID=582475 RepID=UPI001416FC39